MPGTETRFAVLLFTDIVASTALKAQYGVPAYSAALKTHNDHFERTAHECLNVRTLQSRGDGYFAEAGSVAEAVRFALLFEEAMREGPWSEVRLTTRIGIHAGEISALEAEDGTWIVGPAADLAARVTSLAGGGQILLTRFPFDEARHFIREHPPVAGKSMPPLRWLAHGPYLLKGSDQPMEIFEVGADGLAPLTAPPDSEKAKRAIRPGEEETLGWRPAVGLEIPGRTGWHLTERLGAGGFGEVWVGEHAKLHQRRAFKFCFDDERLRALKREVTLVRLLRSALGEREDIVHLHELKLDAPPFYLESDLAPHGNLLQWAESQGGLDKIPLERRIALVAHTATALAAAHSIGVLHKDIKPTNILIFDGPNGEPRPRLVDFGIGTLADHAMLGQIGITAAGFTDANIKHSTGTPTYSPPEYLAGKPYTIQGDIYGLGVLLYQLVTVKPIDPLAPGWERDVPDPLLREDIAACVDGDPARRLPSATDLADRLLHLEQRRSEIDERDRLASEAAARADAEAHAATARHRATRLRKLTTAFAILALLAMTGGVLAWMNQRKVAAALAEVGKQKAEVDRMNAEYRAMLVEAARSDRLLAEDKLRGGDERGAFAYLAHAIEYDPASTLAAEKAAASLNEWQYFVPSTILIGHSNRVTRAQFSADGARVVTASDDGTAKVWDAVTGKELLNLAPPEGGVGDAVFGAAGARIVTISGDIARIWDSVTGKTLATLAGHTGYIYCARFSADGGRIVTASSDKTARVWDVATGQTLGTLAGHTDSVYRAEFGAAGGRILTTSSDRTVQLWDAVTGKTLVTLTLGGDTARVPQAHFSGDGARVVTTFADTARVWDAATGQTLATLEGASGEVESVQFSADGTRIATVSGATVRVWDAATGKILTTFEDDTNSVRSAQFSADGTRIVTASYGRSARVWDAITGQMVATFEGHTGTLWSAQFSADGTQIVTASSDHTARVWHAANGKAPGTLKGHTGSVHSAHFSADGARVVTASSDKTARVWDATTRKTLAALEGHTGPVYRAEFSSNGACILTASSDQTARVWDAATGQTLAILPGHTGRLTDAKFSADGTRILTTSADKTARVWDAATGKTLTTFEGHTSPVIGGQFSSNGARIVTFSEDNTARVWDAVTGKSLVTFVAHTRPVRSAQFSTDGSRVVTTSDDETARIWNTVTGQVFATLKGHTAWVWNGQFSANDTRIITTSWDATARVWDANTGQTLATLEGHTGPVYRAQLSGDGQRIVTASYDTTARVWDAITCRNVSTLEGHTGIVWNAQFSADGSRIVTASDDETARIWDVLPPTAGPPPKWFPDFLRYLAQMHLNSNGETATYKPDSWLALRERMRTVRRASAGQDTPYLRILRRFVPE